MDINISFIEGNNENEKIEIAFKILKEQIKMKIMKYFENLVEIFSGKI